jgi:pimeloyl-ACP methyl ester carboxylesterase
MCRNSPCPPRVLSFILLLPAVMLSLTTARTVGEQVTGPRTEYLDIGDYRLHFRVWSGVEPSVLFESGGGGDSTQWDTMATQVIERTGAGVITYDRAGFGQSDLPPTPYDIEAEVDALWSGLQRLAPNHSFVLVAHSYGAFLTALFAAKHPQVVK